MSDRRQQWIIAMGIGVMCVGIALFTTACSGGGSSGKASASEATEPSASTVSSPPSSGSEVSTNTTATDGALTGTWSGRWQRTSPPAGGGTYDLTLQQQGDTLTGTLVTSGSACLATHPISGTVNGSEVAFRVLGDDSTTASYTGTVSGSSMSGTATVSCSAGTGTASWQVTKN